jgi:hypothetical protein
MYRAGRRVRLLAPSERRRSRAQCSDRRIWGHCLAFYFKLAEQAGFHATKTNGAHIGYFWWSDECDLDDELMRFALLVAAHEREACAKVCDGWTGANGDVCAEAIRARGEK